MPEVARASSRLGHRLRAPRKIGATHPTPQNCRQMIPLRSRSDSFTFTPGPHVTSIEGNFSRCPINETGEIFISPIRSEISYATALHELGHIFGRHQHSRSEMVRERWAWKWARANALVWTPRMERDARKAMELISRKAIG